VSPARSRVPAYLSRLTGGAVAAAPRLRPSRPLFPPAADALTGNEPEAPLAGLGAHADPIQPGRTAGQPGPVPTSSAADSPAGAQEERTRGGRPGAQPPRGRPLHAPPAPLASALPRPQATPAVPAQVFGPAAQGLSSGPAPGAATQAPLEPAAHSSATPAADPAGSRAAQPLAARPLAPVLTAPSPAAPLPDLLPVAAPAPPLVAVGGAEQAATRTSTKSPLPTVQTPALIPPKQVRITEHNSSPVARRPDPLDAPASSAQVSIGTIEVTVVAPTPPPIPSPPVHSQPPPAGPRAPGRAGADAARQAARGAARRWFGAGQS
jgi:hypothetical protein